MATRPGQWRLSLFIGAPTPKTASVIQSVRAICEEHLHGHYILRIIDISQHPALARASQIIATPTLIKDKPDPVRRFIGDMSASAKLLAGLDLKPGTPSHEKALC